MATTLDELLNGQMPKNEYDYAVLSDKLWGLGTLDEIKDKVTQKVFTIHICINTIGIWKGDGWEGVIADNPHLLPYIADSLEAIGLSQISKLFAEVLTTFPPITDFNDTALFCDVINFLLNPRFKVTDVTLNEYSPEQRASMSTQYRTAVAALDDATIPLWECNAPDDEGWGKILSYMQNCTA